MPTRAQPALSAIVVTPRALDLVARLVDALAAQTISDQIELVLITCHDGATRPDQLPLAAFHSWQLVRIPAFESLAIGRAAGVTAASADIVVFTEDHCFPEPEWAAALLSAYEAPHSVVAPALRNANPNSRISQAQMVIEYGPWMAPIDSGDHAHLPGHNSSYRRSVLLAVDDLAHWLEVEYALHDQLRQAGHTLFLTAEARTAHMNFGRIRGFTAVTYHFGRKFAAFRVAGWSLPRRLLYIAASWLIPFVRLRRTWRHAQRAGLTPRERWALLPYMLWGLLSDGCGQLVGYITGRPGPLARLMEYEIDRERFC